MDTTTIVHRTGTAALVALVVAACGQAAPAAAPGTASASVGPTDPGTPTEVVEGPSGQTDGPVRTLSEEQRVGLEEGGAVVVATFELSDGVVVALGAGDETGTSVELVGVPDGVLVGGSFGGSGELLLPDDVCTFQTVDERFTVVVTADPQVTVTVEGPDGRRAVEEATAAQIGGRTVGVVLVEVGHTMDSPRPSADPGGEC